MPAKLPRVDEFVDHEESAAAFDPSDGPMHQMDFN